MKSQIGTNTAVMGHLKTPLGQINRSTRQEKGKRKEERSEPKQTFE